MAVSSAPYSYDCFAPGDMDAYARLARQAFARDGEVARYLRGSVGDGNIRVVRHGSDIVGTLAMLPAGQVYGGRVVPMVGIANVTVSILHRGRGVNTRMMRGMLEECRERGFPLSTLYSLSLPVYRRAGYEIAGIRTNLRSDPAKFAELGGDFDFRLLDLPCEQPLLARVHAAQAAVTNGHVARSDVLWQRKLAPRGAHIDGYVLGGAEPRGYVLLHHAELRRLDVVDWCALDGDAARQILRFLAAHRTTVWGVHWDAGPEDPLTHLAPFQSITVDHQRHWMTRVVDVPAALGARGYAASATGRLALDIHDPLLPWNDGRFVMEVRDGLASVSHEAAGRPGGIPTLRMDVRALAPLFTAHMPAGTLARLGMVEGEAAALALADHIFAGPRPWMTDVF